MSKDDFLKPGETSNRSGQYGEFGPRGGRKGTREITSVEGDRLPPTKEPGNKWKLIDPTKHNR